MQAFETVRSIVAPIDRANIDTDAIIPKQFLKSVKRSGFGPNLFDEWRYLDRGEPGQDCQNRPLNPDFILNQTEFRQTQVLLTRKNFGCGSSREHAPWALSDFGIKVIIAPSFADIFYNNCFKNGILPVVLSAQQVEQLFQSASVKPLYVTVDLPRQCLSFSNGDSFCFELESNRKNALLQGLDEIGETLSLSKAIDAFERQHHSRFPWLSQLQEDDSFEGNTFEGNSLKGPSLEGHSSGAKTL